MSYTARDIQILARTLYGEARGESWAGKVAVAWVVRNRAELDLHNDGKPDWWGEGIAGVCLKPWQFSCWNADDPNRDKLLKVTPADPFFRECLAAAAAVLGNIEPDPTAGATHYHTTARPTWATAWPPKWADGQSIVATVHNHQFYRLEA